MDRYEHSASNGNLRKFECGRFNVCYREEPRDESVTQSWFTNITRQDNSCCLVFHSSLDSRIPGMSKTLSIDTIDKYVLTILDYGKKKYNDTPKSNTLQEPFNANRVFRLGEFGDLVGAYYEYPIPTVEFFLWLRILKHNIANENTDDKLLSTIKDKLSGIEGEKTIDWSPDFVWLDVALSVQPVINTAVLNTNPPTSNNIPPPMNRPFTRYPHQSNVSIPYGTSPQYYANWPNAAHSRYSYYYPLHSSQIHSYHTAPSIGEQSLGRKREFLVSINSIEKNGSVSPYNNMCEVNPGDKLEILIGNETVNGVLYSCNGKSQLDHDLDKNYQGCYILEVPRQSRFGVGDQSKIDLYFRIVSVSFDEGWIETQALSQRVNIVVSSLPQDLHTNNGVEKYSEMSDEDDFFVNSPIRNGDTIDDFL